MAPVETDAAMRSNSLPVAMFGGQVLLVTGLSAFVLYTARRAAQTQPPSTRTRMQHPVRRHHAVVFSLLAFLSLAFVTTFAVLWRAISYVEWAEHKHHAFPGGIWNGWYGTGVEQGWRLGDWIMDVDLVRQSDAVTIRKPEGFLYTSQYAVGLLASSIFMGVEGLRRNLTPAVIASFVLLASLGSLGYALNLFFVVILYTPVSQHKPDTASHDALFSPSPVVYDIAIASSTMILNLFPELVATYGDVRITRLIYLAAPLFLAFAPQIIPIGLGRRHGSKAAAHRSYAHAFYVLSITSFLLYWRLFISNVYANTPAEHSYPWDVFTNSISKGDSSRSNRLLQGFSKTGQKLKYISTHPAVSVTSLDVLFTTISILTWTFTRDLDVDAILENSVLSFLAPKHEKHVGFGEKVGGVKERLREAVHTDTPKKRGRPAKKDVTANGISASSSGTTVGSVRQSTRRKKGSVDLDSSVGSAGKDEKTRTGDYESEMESAYQPSEETEKDVAEMEVDGAMGTTDLVHAGESTALALFLTFAGGLGQLAASALGAEVTGP